MLALEPMHTPPLPHSKVLVQVQQTTHNSTVIHRGTPKLMSPLKLDNSNMTLLHITRTYPTLLHMDIIWDWHRVTLNQRWLYY